MAVAVAGPVVASGLVDTVAVAAGVVIAAVADPIMGVLAGDGAAVNGADSHRAGAVAVAAGVVIAAVGHAVVVVAAGEVAALHMS